MATLTRNRRMRNRIRRFLFGCHSRYEPISVGQYPLTYPHPLLRLVSSFNIDFILALDLGVNTLTFGYVIPAIRAYSGLPPVRQCSCRFYYPCRYFIPPADTSSESRHSIA